MLGPVTATVQFIVRKTLSLFGADIEEGMDVLSAREELRGAIDFHHREGAVVKHDRDMLGGVLDLDELEVSDVMVARAPKWNRSTPQHRARLKPSSRCSPAATPACRSGRTTGTT